MGTVLRNTEQAWAVLETGELRDRTYSFSYETSNGDFLSCPVLVLYLNF